MESGKIITWLFALLLIAVSLPMVSSLTVGDCGTGGNVSVDGDFCVHQFTTNGTFSFNDTISATILLVGGGGGGGGDDHTTGSGGGGAGGLIYVTGYSITSGAKTVEIGLGGAGGTGGTQPGFSGGSTIFNGLTTVGGGGGGGDNAQNGVDGGSAGGGKQAGLGGSETQTGQAGDSGTYGFGNNGGDAGATYGGGGGGGSSTAGLNGIDGTLHGGDGGNGTQYSINGTAVYYAGGGGGGGGSGGASGIIGIGGLGGGGNGGNRLQAGSSATANTGGGGGGAGAGTGPLLLGGSGGSGIVIVRYNPGTDLYPEVTLNSPLNNTQTTTTPISFNVTVTDDSLVQNVTLYIDGVLNQTNSSNFNGTYIFNAGVDIGTHNWSILAFDNASQSTQSATRTFEYQRVLENSVTFTTPITEGTSNVYTVNLSTDGSTISTAYFNYSGTDYLLTPYTYTDYIILNKTLTTPLVSGSENKTFNWRLTFDDTYRFNTTYQTQLVSDILVDNCSSYTYVLYNFTIVNEETQAILNPTTDNTYSEIDMDLSLSDGTALQGYSTTFNQTNPFAICISNNLSGSGGVFIDAQIQYKADGYVSEFYNIQSENFTSSDLNTNITLYDLNSSDAQEFLLTYTDTNFNPVEGAIILIKRKYISEGVFKTVEIPITDANGQSLANLVLSNVIYSFTVMKDGLLLATFDNQVAYCDNIATGDCQIDLSTYSTTSLPDTFSTVGNYVFSIDYNKTSRLITADFTVSSGATATNFLNVTLYGYGGATSVCTDTLVTASGTMTCTIPSQYENSTVKIQLSRDGALVGEAIFTLNQDPDEIYGDSRVFIAIVAFLLIIGIGIVDSPQIQIVLMIMGAIMLVATGLINSGPASSFVGAGATILFFIIALILILVKGGRR